MPVVFKNTIKDILKNKNNIYILFFGTLFFMIGYGLKFSISSGGGGAGPQDLSHYGKLMALHIFIYIFYIAIAISTARDLEDEIENGFIEISLLSLSRMKYFGGKLAAYIISYFFLLELIAVLGTVASYFLLETPFNPGIYYGFAGLGVNIAFIMVMVLFLALSHKLKGAGFIAFLSYILLSLLNSQTVLNWLVRSDKVAEIISSISPAVFHVQNEFIRMGTGFGFTDDFFKVFINIAIYFIVMFAGIVHFMKKYECHA